MLEQVIHSLIRYKFLGNVAVNTSFIFRHPLAFSAFRVLASFIYHPRTLNH
jgi:hypothetical protein